MRANRRQLSSGTSHAIRSWPLLALLLLLILVPTICVLWFMNEAVQNEHSAVREKLRDAYRSHLSVCRERLAAHWRRALQETERLAQDHASPVVFELCVRGELADSVVSYDVDGQIRYPTAAVAAVGQARADADWLHANRLEYQENDFAAAAHEYEAMADVRGNLDPPDHRQAAQSWQAAARCYARAGQTDEALRVLTQVLVQPQYESARDRLGRLIVVDAEMRALELMGDQRDTAFRTVAQRLEQRLMDYGNANLAAAQRRFLMSRLRELSPAVEFPTRNAEQLAATFIDSSSTPTTKPVLASTDLKDVWQLSAADGRILLLFEQASLIEKSRRVLSTPALPDEIIVNVVPPSDTSSQKDAFIVLPIDGPLPGWRLTLALKDRDYVDAASQAQVTAYLWTGILGVGTIAALALVIGHTIRHQTRLARLKNDLVATITHELKTPLSSMRLLVDTLLDKQKLDEDQVREYLQLIGKENERLSRLIDNFLAFSRIERNKYRFDFQPIDPANIVAATADSVHERFHQPSCRLELQVEPDLPQVVADADALVTVLLNLLDNAYKYSGDEKHIRLKAYCEDGAVCFQVEDNGIGLSPREETRVFRRFYQVNQHLSRSGSGCGLGLSIAQYIVRAHSGTIRVASQQGQGSKFTVKLAAASAKVPQTHENLVS